MQIQGDDKELVWGILLSQETVSPGSRAVKNPPANTKEVSSEVSSIPGSGRSLREGNGNPIQYPCLEHFRNRGAWRGHKELDTTKGWSTHRS